MLYFSYKIRKGLNLMKIINKRKQNTIDFAKVPIGRTFIFLHTDEMGSSPYMRIHDVIDEEEDVLNANDLEDGYAVNVGADIPVSLCDAEVIIN